MKTWVVLFLVFLAAGVAWGIARDFLSRQRGSLSGTVVGVDLGNPAPSCFPHPPPRYKVRLPGGG